MRIGVVIGFFIAVGLIIFLLWGRRNDSLLISEYQKILNQEARNKIPNYKAYYKTDKINNFIYSNTAIPPKLSITNEDGKPMFLDELVKNKTAMIVFIFSSKNCDECTDSELKKINDLIKNKVAFASKILIISNFDDPFHLSIFKKERKLTLEIYNSEKIQLLPELNKPFYFVLDHQFKYLDFFIPSKEMPDVTPIYFEKMFAKYLK